MRLYERSERRLSMAITAYLPDSEGRSGTEQIVTENVSSLGARVFTKRPWQSGERLQIAISTNQFRIDARAVYCQPGPNGAFFIGLEFPESRPDWWKESEPKGTATVEPKNTPVAHLNKS